MKVKMTSKQATRRLSRAQEIRNFLAYLAENNTEIIAFGHSHWSESGFKSLIREYAHHPDYKKAVGTERALAARRGMQS